MARRSGTNAALSLLAGLAASLADPHAGGTPAAAAARNQPVSSIRCGDAITQDAVLEADLSCVGSGLEIGAHRITLDLGGHRLEVRGHLAIRNHGFDDVTIRNGTIACLGDEVGGIALLHRADRNSLLDLSIDCGGDGPAESLVIEDSRRARIERCDFDGGYGVRIERSSGTRLLRNVLRTDTYGRWPLRLVSSHHNEVIANEMHAYGSLGLLQSDRNVIRGNRIEISEDGCSGLDLQESDANRIEANEIAGDYCEAISLSASRRNQILRNRLAVHDESAYAVVTLDASERTRLEGNTIEARVAGIVVSGHRDSIVRNVVTQVDGECHWLYGCGDGIHVAAPSVRTRVERNHVEGFLDDGIDVEAASTRLRSNVAEDNGDLGIEAVEGIEHQGGNLAAGNGNPLQCLNVDCD